MISDDPLSATEFGEFSAGFFRNWSKMNMMNQHSLNIQRMPDGPDGFKRHERSLAPLQNPCVHIEYIRRDIKPNFPQGFGPFYDTSQGDKLRAACLATRAEVRKTVHEERGPSVLEQTDHISTPNRKESCWLWFQ